MRKMTLKGFDGLKMALDAPSKATPTTLLPAISDVPALPEAAATPRRVSPFSKRAYAECSLASKVSWYEDKARPVTPREPDPLKEYFGPRFCPPKARLPKRTGQGNLG